MAKSKRERYYSRDTQLQDSGIGEFEGFDRVEDFDTPSSLNSAEELLVLNASIFLNKVRDNLEKLGKVSSGALADDGVKGDLIKAGWSFEIEVGYRKGDKAAKYFDYVNKGVKGAKSSNRAPNSPYGYKDKRPPLNVIVKWLEDERKSGAKDLKKGGALPLSALQEKRATLVGMTNETRRIKGLAFVIAKSIYEKGSQRTGYFDDAIKDTFGKGFVKAMSAAIGTDVAVYIRKAVSLINRKKP